MGGGSSEPTSPHASGTARGRQARHPQKPPERAGSRDRSLPVSWRGDAGGTGCAGGRVSGKRQQRLPAGEQRALTLSKTISSYLNIPSLPFTWGEGDSALQLCAGPEVGDLLFPSDS